MMIGIDELLLIYPVDREILSVIKSTENYLDIHICRLVSLESWGHIGECYKCASGMVTISCDYDNGLNDCSVLWIVDSWNELDFKLFIEPVIRLAAKKGKRIVCSRELTSSEKESLTNLEVVYVEYPLFAPKITRDDRIQEIKTPVYI